MTVAIDPAVFAAAMGDGDATASLSALRDRIADIAREVEAPFVAAGAMLMTVVEAMDRIIAELEAVAGAIDRPAASASVADLKRVADRLMALPETHAVRTARMDEVADAAKELGGSVATAGRTLRIMDIFGMNIGVASEGEPEFVGFVRHMSEKLAQGERDLAAMAARLTELSDGIAAMRGADRQLSSESLQIIPHVPTRLIGDATALEEHLAASERAAAEVAATARRLRDQIAVMLGAMQVGDRIRQRLEHVAAGLAMAETLPADGATPAAVAHFQRLLIAQIEATAADFDGDAAMLATAFAALQPDARQLLELMENRTRSGGGGSIAELETGIGEVMALTRRLCAADERASAMHRLVADAIDELSRRLDGVRRLRSNVQVLATNIALLCRRHGQIGRGVSAIADQIDVQASALPQVTENIARPIGALLTVSDAMRQDAAAPIDAAAILSGAVTILREGLRRSEAAASGRQGSDGRELIDLVGTAADKIDRERDLAVRIRDCAASLTAQTPDAAEPDDADLAALTPVLQSLGALYTMAQEREIHARFLPPGSEAEPTAAATDDDEDDGLF